VSFLFILEVVYALSIILLAIYGLNSLLLTWLYRRQRGRRADLPARDGVHFDPVVDWLGPDRKLGEDEAPYPHITVQLPVYNERHVVERLLEAVVHLDWPAERLQIQVLDDSTDDTSQIIAAALRRYRAQGTPRRLEHVRRPDRQGFKAGALQYGLASANGEFVAIFDADFIPPADFLRKTIPCFRDARVGCVQTRWGHVNPDSSQLTRAQALGIDGHFVVEQSARHAIQAYLNFNGTAGVWRRVCMKDAGGWQGDTLTEDLDLSYRAQLRDWRIIYQPDLVVPAELPVQIDAFKRQQFRWAKGSIQTALKLLGRLWRTSHPVWLKVMGTLHLTNYSVHPLMLVNLLLILPMAITESPILRLTPVFTLAAIGPPAVYWTAMAVKSVPLPTRLGRLAVLIGLGTGLSVNNTRAVLEAVLGLDSEFKRTPKFAVTARSTRWQTSSYALPRDPAAWLELLLALYACGLLAWILSQGIWGLIPWLLMYAGGNGYVSALAFAQAWQARSVRSQGLA
jgi:cellulose synthase/poly-beta-1,6-N-acetylglucosamine synthase-like glycosyltransferase